MLAQIAQVVVPEYYAPALEGVQADGEVLQGLAERWVPQRMRSMLEAAGVPAQWLEGYRERMSEPTQAAVHQAMQSLTPHKMSLVVVGNEDIASALAPYGRVRIVSVESFLRSGLTYAVSAKTKSISPKSKRKKSRKRRRRRR